MNDNLKVAVVLLAKLMISLFDNNEERELNDSEVEQDFEKLKLAINMLESEPVSQSQRTPWCG